MTPAVCGQSRQQIQFDSDWRFSPGDPSGAEKTAFSDGVLVPTANNLISFAVSGPDVVAAVDNGDNSSHESFKHRNAAPIKVCPLQ